MCSRCSGEARSQFRILCSTSGLTSHFSADGQMRPFRCKSRASALLIAFTTMENVQVKRYLEVDDAVLAESAAHPEFQVSGDSKSPPVIWRETGTSQYQSGPRKLGSVLKLNDRLLVIATNGETLRLDGAPARWRIFPKFRNTSIIYMSYTRTCKPGSLPRDAARLA